MNARTKIQKELLPVLRRTLQDLYFTEPANAIEEKYILEWKRRIERCILGDERIIDRRGRKPKTETWNDEQTLSDLNQPNIESWRKVTE